MVTEPSSRRHPFQVAGTLDPSPWRTSIHDGRPDLLAAINSIGSVRVLLNNAPTATSDPYTIEKTLQPPSITAYNHALHSVDGLAAAGSSIRLFDGTTLMGQVTADAAGHWSISTGAL